jgi:hypothetical protein
MTRFLFVLFVLLFVGCLCETPTEEPISSPFKEKSPECLLVFAIDPSSPFRDNLLNETGLWDFWLGTMTNYARRTVGKDSELIVTPLTGDGVTWFRGSMGDFKDAIQSPEELKNMLRREVRNQSTAYSSLADTLDYLLRIPGVSERKTTVYLVVLGDMVDQSPKDRVVGSMTRFYKAGCGIAFYWPNRNALPEIDSILDQSGFGRTQWTDSFKPRPLFDE